YEVGIHRFKVGRGKDAAGQNALTEPRSETLDLIFQLFQHVHLRSVRNVAVRPRRLFGCGSAGWIKQTWLSEQDKWGIGGPPLSSRLLRCGNLFKAPSQVHRRRTQACRSLPWDGPAQC